MAKLGLGLGLGSTAHCASEVRKARGLGEARAQAGCPHGLLRHARGPGPSASPEKHCQAAGRGRATQAPSGQLSAGWLQPCPTARGWPGHGGAGSQPGTALLFLSSPSLQALGTFPSGQGTRNVEHTSAQERGGQRGLPGGGGAGPGAPGGGGRQSCRPGPLPACGPA